jgi:phytol kinase
MLIRNNRNVQHNVNKLKIALALSILLLLIPTFINAKTLVSRGYYADIPSHNNSLLPALLQNTSDFIYRAMPSFNIFVIFTPILFLYTWFSLWFASFLKVQKALKTAYTRKVFHVMIFLMAGILQIVLGLSGVVLFGIIVVLFVLFSVFKGNGFPFYEALARPKDEPRRSIFVVLPLLTTALGGVLANVLFYPFALVGYFVCGCGDAVGEPIGAKWGKHEYKIPSAFGVKVTRSIEGSIGVLIVGFLAAFFALLFSSYDLWTSLYVGFVCGLGGALVEAVSTHGFDNLTIQVIVSGIAYLLLR